MKLKDVKKSIQLQNQILTNAKSNNSKLHIAFVNHNAKNFAKIGDSVKEELTEKQLELALTGDKGQVLYQEDKESFLFNKEGLRSLNRFVKELEEKEFIFKFYLTKFEALTEEEKEFIFKDNAYHANMDQELFDLLSNFISDLPEFKIAE